MTTLSAHEVLRFSIDHKEMRVRHVSLNYHRVIVSLRDTAPERNLWEVANTRGTARLTRFPKNRRVGFDGPFECRLEAHIPENLFARVIVAHRPALLEHNQDVVVFLRTMQANAAEPDDVAAATERLRERQAVAFGLFQGDFPRV